jgi:hypothetical protein
LFSALVVVVVAAAAATGVISPVIAVAVSNSKFCGTIVIFTVDIVVVIVVLQLLLSVLLFKFVFGYFIS